MAEKLPSHLPAWPLEIICYCLIFVVGLLGNLFVCVVIWKSGPTFRRVPFNVYLMALAITDAILAVVCLPIYLLSLPMFRPYHPKGTDGRILCQAVTGYVIPFWLSGVSIYLLVIISFERYEAVSNPFLARTKIASKWTALYIIIAWVISSAVNAPTIVGVGYIESESFPKNYYVGNYCTYIWNPTTKVIFSFTFVFQFTVPAAVFIFNLLRIRRCLNKLDTSLAHGFQDSQQQLIVIERKKRTVRIMFIASLMFFVCWTPNNAMYFTSQFGLKGNDWNSPIYQAGILLGFFNSCINPFIYAFISKDFRDRCKKVLKEISGGKKERGEMFVKSTQSQGNYGSVPNNSEECGSRTALLISL
eukprot:Seg1405.5 transcript_id=Seg1405.5/GoldUCD/mRNA.D3Y31 product="Phe13-bombesin receptor" protein_id=Seg1405.5/GoldUCD/D3Y31